MPKTSSCNNLPEAKVKLRRLNKNLCLCQADATKFSETGIVGEDAEDVVRQLVDAAGGSSEVAQYGMVHSF